MTTLAYPSADFPGPPAVALEVPDGWEPLHAPGTTLAARLPREESLGQVADVARSRGGAVSEPYAADLGDARFVGCDATWPDADVETVLQANLFHVVAGEDGAPGYLVQLTGAVGGAEAETDYELIRDVITTVRVTPWDASTQGTGA
jgi:hypothetical protein